MRNPAARGWPECGERTSDPEVAQRWAWAYLDLVRGEHRSRVLKLPRDRRLKDTVTAYLEHRRATMEKATWSADRTALAYLTDHFQAHLPLHRVERDELQKIVRGMLARSLRASTIYTYRKSWQTFFRWAGDHDPTLELALPDPGRTDIVTFEPDELVRLRAAAQKVDRQQIGRFPSARLAVEIALTMGLRQGEIFALRWEAIDPDEKSVRVNWQVPKDSTTPKPLKGKRARSALVLPAWWPHHRQQIGLLVGRDGRPVGTRTQRNLITRVLDTAGLNRTGLGWHILRHTYARHFIEMGGRFEELQLSLGHKSIVITQERYGHFTENVAVRLAKERVYGA